MKLKLETKRYDELQAIFIKEIIEKIRIKLHEEGLEDRKIEDLTASISFSIASIIDDTSRIESDGVEVRPYLTFREGDDEIVHCGENSDTHDFVMGTLKKLFPH